MGVKHLWSILQPVCKKEPLENMRGKTLCVDLSTWICQAEEIVPLKSAVAKPYLRNTIFRVLCLKRLGTQLIFVTEGTPPQLKWDVIVARAKAREEAEKEGKTFGKYSSKKKRPGSERQGKGVGSKFGKDNCNEASANCQPKKVGRSTFQRKINEVFQECAQLLRLLGIPVVKSEGEAEACCALLNRKKVADGCITEDGDTFLYGGEVIYKNLGISNKDPHVYSYSLENIEAEIGIARQEMVALALLLGCDYTDGVSGVGKLTAIKLLKELCDVDILERFKLWATEKKCPDTASTIEKQVFKKIMKVEGFPNEEVIREFLVPRDDIDQILPQIRWGYPDIVNLQRFCFKHMDWPEEYTLSKVLGVATNEYLHRIPRGIPLESPLSAIRLVKTRIQHGVPLCEVEWKTDTSKRAEEIWRGYPDTFITLESQQSILVSLPSLVEEFEKIQSAKKRPGKKKTKKVESSSKETAESNEKEMIGNSTENSEEDAAQEKEVENEAEMFVTSKVANKKKVSKSCEDIGNDSEEETQPMKFRIGLGRKEDENCDDGSQFDHRSVSKMGLQGKSGSQDSLQNSTTMLEKSSRDHYMSENTIDDVARSLSNLDISRSSNKESCDCMEERDRLIHQVQKNESFETGNFHDKPSGYLPLKERLLNRTSSRVQEKNQDSYSHSKLTRIKDSHSHSMLNDIQDSHSHPKLIQVQDSHSHSKLTRIEDPHSHPKLTQGQDSHSHSKPNDIQDPHSHSKLTRIEDPHYTETQAQDPLTHSKPNDIQDSDSCSKPTRIEDSHLQSKLMQAQDSHSHSKPNDIQNSDSDSELPRIQDLHSKHLHKAIMKENLNPSIDQGAVMHCRDFSADGSEISKSSNAHVQSVSEKSSLIDSNNENCMDNFNGNSQKYSNDGDSSCKSRIVKSAPNGFIPAVKTMTDNSPLKLKVTFPENGRRIKETSSDSNVFAGITDNELSDSMNDLILSESIGSISLLSNSLYSSPVTEREDCTLSEKAFDSEKYMSNLRTRLQIADCEQSIQSNESPARREIESPNCQTNEKSSDFVPLSLIERIKLRSKRL